MKEYHNHTFLCKMSIAVWSANALRDVLLSAAVRYMCTSKNLWWPASSSACSSSIWFSSLMNHSNDFWSRFIQKKSTLIEMVRYAVNCIIYKKINRCMFWNYLRCATPFSNYGMMSVLPCHHSISSYILGIPFWCLCTGALGIVGWMKTG